jgi:hypothetical protein
MQALLSHAGVAARAEIEGALAQAFAWLLESGAEALRLYRAMDAEGHVARLTAGT